MDSDHSHQNMQKNKTDSGHEDHIHNHSPAGQKEMNHHPPEHNMSQHQHHEDGTVNNTVAHMLVTTTIMRTWSPISASGFGSHCCLLSPFFCFRQ